MKTEKYEMNVGLEVHAELKTRSKIFCSCPTDYGAPPNTQVCPVCLGMPGTMPVLNRRAVELAVRAGAVTHCEIMRISRFDRKNYFYPDLPKGYQITQYEQPICRRGFLEIETDGAARKIGITRIHLEEDAGKLSHNGSDSGIDFNRCGIPLIEIVSEPDIRSAEEAKAYLNALRELLVFADVSDCKMNEGSMRCDVNLSVRLRGKSEMGARTEIKNINSIAFVGRAIAYEYMRQVRILEAGGEIFPQTRRYDEDRNETVLMREKETAADYRYFREPDLPAVAVSDAEITTICADLPVMPRERRAFYAERYGIALDAAQILTASPARADYFEKAAEMTEYPRNAANLLIGELLPEYGDNIPLPPETLAHIADLAGRRRVSAAGARRLTHLCTDGRDPVSCAEKENLLLLTDRREIASLTERAFRENPEAARQLANGKLQAKQILIGAVMRFSGGRADASVVSDEIEKQAGK